MTKKPTFKANSRTLPQARRMRKESPVEEGRLWQRLRNRQIVGAKFRRQARIGRYIVDFACLEAKLIVEVDGGVHRLPGRRERDAVRQQWLQSEGYRVLRFDDLHVREEIDAVVHRIAYELNADRPSPPAPLPQGERGGL